MSLDPNMCKERLSDAYLQAVVTTARMSMTKPSVDNDSVDWTIAMKGGMGKYSSPRLEVQLKCTSDAVDNNSDEIKYPLKLKNYQELRAEDLYVPRILVVVFVPDDIDRWVEQTEETLLVRHCGYWLSLRGMPESSNSTSVTVSIPRTQIFTAVALKEMMLRIGNGEMP